MQHTKINPYRYKYSPKYRARIAAREKASRVLTRARARTLQRSIVARFRSDLAALFLLPPIALMAYPLGIQRREWAGHKADLDLGLVPGLPSLFLPVLSFDKAHTCLWLCLASHHGPTSSAMAKELASIGHKVVLVQTLEQAQTQLLNYLGY